MKKKIYILQELVIKYMRFRQKTEIKRFNYQPKKMSSTTRGFVKVKCSKNKKKEQGNGFKDSAVYTR